MNRAGLFLLAALGVLPMLCACGGGTTPTSCGDATSGSSTGTGASTASTSSSSGTGGGIPLGMDGGPMKGPTCVTAADCPASLAPNTCNGILCDQSGVFTQPGSPLRGCYLVTLEGKACDSTYCHFPLGTCDTSAACICPDYCTCTVDPSGAPLAGACGSTTCHGGTVWTCEFSVWTQSGGPCDGGA